MEADRRIVDDFIQRMEADLTHEKHELNSLSLQILTTVNTLTERVQLLSKRMTAGFKMLRAAVVEGNRLDTSSAGNSNMDAASSGFAISGSDNLESNSPESESQQPNLELLPTVPEFSDITDDQQQEPSGQQLQDTTSVPVPNQTEAQKEDEDSIEHSKYPSSGIQQQSQQQPENPQIQIQNDESYPCISDSESECDCLMCDPFQLDSDSDSVILDQIVRKNNGGSETTENRQQSNGSSDLTHARPRSSIKRHLSDSIEDTPPEDTPPEVTPPEENLPEEPRCFRVRKYLKSYNESVLFKEQMDKECPQTPPQHLSRSNGPVRIGRSSSHSNGETHGQPNGGTNSKRSVLHQGSSSDHGKSYSRTVYITCKLDNCGCRLESRDAYDRHMIGHEVDAYPCPMVDCAFGFDTRQNLMKHLSEFHPTFNYFPCSACNRTYRSIAGYISHNRDEHEHGEYVCKLCAFTAPYRKQVKHHYVTAHRYDPYRYSCDYPNCGRSYFIKYDLIVHQYTHMRYRPQQCLWAGCDYRTRQRNNIKTHVWNRHLRKDVQLRDRMRVDDFIRVDPEQTLTEPYRFTRCTVQLNPLSFMC